MGLLERFLQGDERALARAISLVEANDPEGIQLLDNVRQKTGNARFLGVTGSPGSGKSTLVDQLIVQARAQDKQVAVLAVDPSSPFSGGAILGDRIRMMQHHQDSKVYIRSMATREHLGGLAASSLQVLGLFDAFGFDEVIVETVGVGQSEIEIVKVADITLLVLSPGQGDGVQAFKAGIMEIADVFVINKADLPGSGRLKREIQAALELGHSDHLPSILETVASRGQGVDTLYSTLQHLYDEFKRSGKLENLKRHRISFELASLLNQHLHTLLRQHQEKLIDDIQAGQQTVDHAIQYLLRQANKT